jgi:YggT family protein
MALIAQLVHRIFQLLQLLVLAHVILSYFMAPYHPIRQFINRFVEPMLVPIRRVMPATGMFDFSSMVLLIILYILDILVVQLLLSF